MHFDSKGLFLSFNYTETLESIYNITRNNIRYLHGRRKSNDKLIVGHCNNIDGENYLPKDPAIYEYQAYRGIADIVNGERKNVTDIILNNNDFWQQLFNIDKVVVYGHSLSDVDRPYFKQVANSKKQASEWYFSIYYHNPQKRIKEIGKVLNMYMGITPNKCHTFQIQDE